MDESVIPPQSFTSIFNFAPYNVIPHPTSLTIGQMQDISPAILGKPEPHKYIYLHFRYSESGISKQIIIHQYRNHRRHNWFSQDDIDKLNLFRIAAITLQTGVDISRDKRCWRFLTKAERKEWFPRLRKFAKETEARETVEEALGKATNEGYANEEVMGDATDRAVDESTQGSIQGPVQEPARRSIGETISGTMEKILAEKNPSQIILRSIANMNLIFLKAAGLLSIEVAALNKLTAFHNARVRKE
ncbi:f5ad3603-9306-4f24-a0e9-8bd2b1496b98 [Sclerotinia trifoliorum]|uniref:F5ad3603-9306-4f24-a0e9-8bd2b1496b98 n=1 Tax=Sclerotinia trifoliorum TaxID=28548 RepID=A0A8H2VQU3_9HELO|nr:f5ad3603-9306-4f24-a0e9-8bd2b1496b98 [Sclerotinia trifoliorum]